MVKLILYTQSKRFQVHVDSSFEIFQNTNCLEVTFIGSNNWKYDNINLLTEVFSEIWVLAIEKLIEK